MYADQNPRQEHVDSTIKAQFSRNVTVQLPERQQVDLMSKYWEGRKASIFAIAKYAQFYASKLAHFEYHIRGIFCLKYEYNLVI